VRERARHAENAPMGKLLSSLGRHLGFLVLVAFGAWYGWTHYNQEAREFLGLAPTPKVRVLGEQFKCDARIWCSQMTSCEETRFFLRYCPGTKLDRNSEGIDCEKQWCGS
jgi:hypothetical protein